MLEKPTARPHLPGLSGLPDTVSEYLDTRALCVTLDQGSVIFGPDRPAQHLLLLVCGTVRVQQPADDGRETVRYRVHAGESCVLTNACLLAFEDRSAEGIAETEVKAVAIPRDSFDEVMSTSAAFRAHVFEACAKRITDLSLKIEGIAFSRMDVIEMPNAPAVERPARVH